VREILTCLSAALGRVHGEVAIALARGRVQPGTIESWADELEQAAAETRALAKEQKRGE